MSDSTLLLLALLLAVFGMACFAATISAHWRQFAGTRDQSTHVRHGLRAGGAVLLALSFAVCAVADPFLMAILVWPMVLTVSAGLVAAGLTIHTRMKSRTSRGDMTEKAS